MASIRKLQKKNGRPSWRVIWSILDASGCRRQPSKCFDSYRDAKGFAAKIVEQERNGVGDPRKLTVSQFLTRWMSTLGQRAELSPTTLTSYEHYARLLSRFIGNIKLERLSTLALDEAYAAMLKSGGTSRGRPSRDGKPRLPKPLSPRSVNYAAKIAHIALESARRQKLISFNPATDARPPQPKKAKIRAMTPDEADRIWQATQEAMKGKRCYPGLDLAVMLFMATGARRSEILGLCWDAVDLDNGRLEIMRSLVQAKDGSPIMREENKTEGSTRSIAITPPVVERLREHRALILRQAVAYGRDYVRDPYFLVFPEHGGVMPTPSAWTARLRRVMQLAGIESTQAIHGRLQPIHGHRHTAATMLLASKVDIKTISAKLGHSSPRVTLDIYVHSEEERDRAAADILGERFRR